jgi:hypothetical protein
MPLITKPNYNQVFASQAPDGDEPEFNNYPSGWGVTRSNNGKPTINQFNYVQQISDLKALWILQNGSCLPYDPSIEYVDGAPVLREGKIQFKNGSTFTDAFKETPYFLKYFVAGTAYPINSRIMLDNGDEVISTIPNNTTDPNVDLTGWKINSNTIGVLNIDELRKTKGRLNAQYAETSEYLSGKGYGGARYKWDSSNTDSDDGLSTIAVTGVTTGRWKLQIINNVLHATQGGLQANLLQTDIVNQTTILQKCIDYMALIGGGVVKLPKGHIYAQAMAKSNVEVSGTFESFVTTAVGSDITASRAIVQAVKFEHGTFWHSTLGNYTYLVPENVSGAGISNLKMLGLQLNQSTSNTGFGIQLIGDSFTAKYVETSGYRFEGLYIRGKDGASCSNHYFENCDFQDARRNTAALVYCHDVKFKNCRFNQLKPELSWVYLFDIEPNPDTSDTVYNVVMENCEFNAVSSPNAEPTVLVKEQNTPTGSPNVKFLNCRFKGVATIRNNCTNGWRDCIVDNCEFDTFAFSTTLGYTIISGKFTNNKMYGLHAGKGFSYNTPATGDFVIEGNTFNDILFTSNILTSQASFGLNTFNGTATVVSPVDRRTLSRQYREIIDITAPTGSALPAFYRSEIRQVSLTTTPVQILTASIRAGFEITITGCDANDATGSKAFVKLFIDSDNSASVTSAQEIINDASLGVTFSWSGRTLSLSARTASANQFIIKVEGMSAVDIRRNVTWLI